jgi:hypothetical protein
LGGDENLYAYVWSIPTTLIDSTGLKSRSPRGKPRGGEPGVPDLIDEILSGGQYYNNVKQRAAARKELNLLASQIPCGEEGLAHFCYNAGFAITSWSVFLGPVIYGPNTICEKMTVKGTKDCCPPCESPYGCYQRN